VFGVTSNDILQHLKQKSFSSDINVKNYQMAEFVVQQSSYYPLFPGYATTDYETSGESQLCPKLLESLIFPEPPHVLLFGSLSTPFVQDISGVVCVNTGRCFKTNSDGTYALLDIHSSSTPEPINGRTRVDVYCL